MKKIHMLGIAVALLLTGCQSTTVDTEVQPDQEQPVIEIEVPSSTETSDEEVTIDDSVVVSDVHEWTASDEETLQAFVKDADAVSIEEAKALLDEKIKDTSSMIADEYVAYYQERLINELNETSNLFFEDTIQQELVDGFDYGYFSRDELQSFQNKEIVAMIDPLYEIGYKVEISEGMYYPIVDYSVLYQYEDYVTNGVKKYLQLKKRESDIMAYSDAAIIVPWSEMADRLLMSEDLLDVHLPKTMKKRNEEEFKWALASYVYGTNNTPVFRYEDMKMSDDEILESFKMVAETGGDRVKAVMVPYLKVLEEENYVGTDKVYETLHGLLNN